MKTKMMKRVYALLLAVCLAAGSFFASAQMTTMTVEAASSTDKALKKKVTAIVEKKVKKDDKKKVKLEKLFKYVEKNYNYGRMTKAAGYKGWEKDFALEMCKKKKGSCYHFAAAYAFLAKEATGYTVRVAIGQTNGFSGKLQPHSWTEVKIGKKWYICDTNMDKYAEDSSGVYFLKDRTKMKKTYNNYKGTKYVTVKL